MGRKRERKRKGGGLSKGKFGKDMSSTIDGFTLKSEKSLLNQKSVSKLEGKYQMEGEIMKERY